MGRCGATRFLREIYSDWTPLSHLAYSDGMRHGVFFAVPAAWLSATAARSQSVIGGVGSETVQPIQPKVPDLIELFSPDLLALFAFDCLIVISIASAIVYHPVRVKARRRVRDLELPRMFLLFGLIGMLIGFLVLQYGAVIGFVVFGIGGLLRFRSTLRTPTDTVEVILVTLIGLCVGLNLQNMAILTGVAMWILIWFFGRKLTFQLTLRHKSTEALTSTIDRLERDLKQIDWRIDHRREVSNFSNQTSANAVATLLVTSRGPRDLSDVEQLFSKLFSGDDVQWSVK